MDENTGFGLVTGPVLLQLSRYPQIVRNVTILLMDAYTLRIHYLANSSRDSLDNVTITKFGPNFGRACQAFGPTHTQNSGFSLHVTMSSNLGLFVPGRFKP